ncbi:MAG: SUMF1/EgtB/PvdO family nonheme iron enzyme [Polyangiaceae bacterium]|nr:SUMF1/EgtB/PvdO family nonheme iron enzyme [Polyangiaceae bacterium]
MGRPAGPARLAAGRRAAPTLALAWLAACGAKAAPTADESAAASAEAAALAPPPAPPTPSKGMIWVPPGVLIAGTPPDRLPRNADVEMPGEQVVMKGFFIDEYPYPNEQGAIPKANVTQGEARSLCEAQSKRLCTELEWERACKGPANLTYPASDVYRASDCGTGSVPLSVPPNGASPACRSGFGLRDSHGVVGQWTASAWGRGSVGAYASVRGGGGPVGEVSARCANATARRPEERRPDLGFRCCSGEANLAEVTLNLVRGDGLRLATIDPTLVEALRQAPPAELGARAASFQATAAWRWRPISNEEFVVQAGCAPSARGRSALCGVAFSRPRGRGGLEPMSFAAVGEHPPTVREDPDPRLVWVHGFDGQGSFRRRVALAFGRIEVGPVERKTRH